MLYLKRKLIEAGGETFVGKKSLVALDTDHIKGYVFGTDKLKEIRGASSWLDYLNRIVMEASGEAAPYQARKVYANGGSGLFVVYGAKDKAELYGKELQRLFREVTADGSSMSYVVQELPPKAPDEWEELLDYPLGEELEL